MSIGATLHNALSGLSVAARSIELVSSNVANAATKGYARREAMLSVSTLAGQGNGVRFAGVERVVDQTILSELRLSSGSVAGQQSRLDFLSRLNETLGTPDDDASLNGRLTRFEATLVEAATRPSSEARLSAVVDAAKGLISLTNQVSDQIQSERLRAETSINDLVGSLNDKLSRIAQLNSDIRAYSGGGQDTAALQDQRQLLIDEVSDIVPLREVPRDHGQVALLTPGGAVLLDGTPAVFGFSPANMITADMTVGTGGLQLVTMNGQPVGGGIPGPKLAGGTLEALFDVRDNQAVTAQERMDAFARELIERFSGPGADPTLASGAPGLFTDAGAAYSSSAPEGLAGRLSLNAIADPATGGALWKLRSGLGAAAPLEAGDATQLARLSDTLTTAATPLTPSLGATAKTVGDLASEVMSQFSGFQAARESDLTYSVARTDTLRARFLKSGVDTDQEMQKLLAIEQAYAANARVVSTVDELIQLIMGI